MKTGFQKIVLLIFVLICSATGCRPSYEDNFLKRARAKKYTEKQQYAAVQYSYRLKMARERTDEPRVYDIAYNLLNYKDVRKRLDGVVSDFEQLLGYESEDDAKFVDLFGLRPYLEEQEKVLIEIRNRVKTLELKAVFDRLIGGGGLSYSWNFPSVWSGSPFGAGWGLNFYPSPLGDDSLSSPSSYNIKKLFPAKDFRSAYNFSIPQVDSAKTQKTLRKIETGALFLNRKYDRKEQDPLYPNDSNEFVWRTSNRKLGLVGFKIQDNEKEKPANNASDYMEVFRLSEKDTIETSPCVKLFRIEDRKVVIVVDTDKEGKPGYGLPDEVFDSDNSWSSGQQYESIKDVLRDEALIASLFDEKKTNPNRIRPIKKKISVEIAKAEDPLDFWEDAPSKEGWLAPSGYKGPLADNYNVRIGFKKTKKASSGSMHAVTKEIEYFAKEWTTADSKYRPASNSPTEYYYPKGDFAGKNISEARVDDFVSTKFVRVIFLDGSIRDGFIPPGDNNFIGNEPYAVLYEQGENWWMIKKSDGSSVFDKRRKASPPKELTGWYDL